MKRLLILLICCLGLFIFTSFAYSGGTIIYNPTGIYITIAYIGLIILIYSINIIRYMYLVLKNKTFFKLLKEENGHELIQELQELLQASEHLNLNIVLLSFTNKEVIYSPIFYKLVDNITHKKYISIKHFWLSIRAFAEKDYNNFYKEVIKFKSLPHTYRSLGDKNLLNLIIDFLISDVVKENDYIKLKKKIRNKVLIDIIEQKHNYTKADYETFSNYKPNDYYKLLEAVDDKLSVNFNGNNKVRALIVVIIVVALFCVPCVMGLAFPVDTSDLYNESSIIKIEITITEITNETNSYIIKSEEYGNVRFIIFDRKLIINNDIFNEIQAQEKVLIGVQKGHLKNEENIEFETEIATITTLSYNDVDLITLDSYNLYFSKFLKEEGSKGMYIFLSIFSFVIILCIISLLKEKSKLKENQS